MKKQNGITLIALVITIIVLLILAGVSIALLTGDNGIFTKATQASEETKRSGAEEKVKLAVAETYNNSGKINLEDLKTNIEKIDGWTNTEESGSNLIITVDGIIVLVNSDGKISTKPLNENLPSTDNTKPYLPSKDFSKVDGTDLNTGLVIKDNNGNSYVWVEVPKTIFTTATSNTDYANIQKDIDTYSSYYQRKGFADVWYDGCVLTESQYNNLKNTMLKSLYDNGGFWVSQYEIGTETLRTNTSDELTTPLSKENVYVYVAVTGNQSQNLANEMYSGNYTSSLMFGSQWDLIMKFLEDKGDKTQHQLKVESSEWGNYSNATFDITKGEYSEDLGKTFNKVIDNYTKQTYQGVLLTTGATTRNSSLNIYDLAGNVYEWTLQKSDTDAKPVTRRGGYYNSVKGEHGPAYWFVGSGVKDASLSIGFRTVIY